ncbi:hypothetical protein CEXT_158121 [Caerostris extrusa]|uniref:Uncharacterized protein n=1 Tax=Caerostris extrusa TaxID=172846 RepID=A0AAV4MUH3_CAEEX|nr:hypothetical protein CEXT_158121 [Caerostris extrusa]
MKISETHSTMHYAKHSKLLFQIQVLHFGIPESDSTYVCICSIGERSGEHAGQKNSSTAFRAVGKYATHLETCMSLSKVVRV